MKIKGSKLSCAILQPHYLPWIGYFEMIDRVDVFVFHDDVQFIKGEWKNRNKIRKDVKSNDFKWITVPVKNNTKMSAINEVQIDYTSNWYSKHLNNTKSSYAKTPFFNEVYQIIEHTLLNKHKTLSELNIILIQGICRYLQIKTRFTTASELGVTGKKVGKLVDLCKRLGADYYLANNASSSYLDTEMLETNGIKCEYQNYEHPTYEQWYNKYLLPFISHLSIIDLLFNYGHNSLEIIRKGNQQL